ncbi:MAG: NAD-dependent epimerase/dehydratase family protein [bacterium]|nr:NAD-dependent epimerase/dehydratase family protein [bacterium]
MAPTLPLKISATNSLPVALVAGGAGFLGASLCRLLVRKKAQVICIDNFLTGKRQFVEDLTHRKNFLLLEHDLNSALPKIERVDYIFHLAGLEEYLDGKDVTLETFRVNSLGTQNLLELAIQTKAKFLFASSLDVFSHFPLSTRVARDLDEQQKSFSHHEAKRFSESLIGEYSRRYGLDCRIVRLTDIYGPGMDLEAGTEMAKLIRSANEGEPLIILDDGLEIIYPTFDEDAVEGILKAIFLPQTKGKIYNLLGTKITIGKFAQILYEVAGKKSEILFRKSKGSEPKLLLPPDFKKTQEELGWQPSISIEEGLQKTLPSFETAKAEEVTGGAVVREEEKIEEISETRGLVEEEKKAFFLPSVMRFFLAVILFLAAVSFPLLSISWDLFWGQKNLTDLEKNNLSFNSLKTESKATAAVGHFSGARGKIEDLQWVFQLTGQERKQEELLGQVMLGEEIALGAVKIAKGGGGLQKIGGNILKGEKIEVEEINKVKILLAGAATDWGEVEAKLKSGKGGDFASRVGQISAYRKLLTEAVSGLEVLSELIGTDGPKTYLLLLQNNMEIRPSGGFIGSYGLLIFDKGTLVDLKIEDVYTADGQLKGHVEPPEPIKKYLGKEHWFLRDSNWSPDFPQAAVRAQWFLEKEIGVKADGVLALDLNSAQEILKALGPVELRDYQETIDSENLFEKTQKHTEEDFFPGSTQKRDFLGSLLKALIEEGKNGEGNWFGLGTAVSRALAQRHLLLYFEDPLVEQQVLQNNWGGEIKDTPCRGETSCRGDYLMVVEANLGINKVNYWVKKETHDEISFSEDGRVSHQLRLSYNNLSSNDSWAGGTYKNYLRIYAPQEATFSGIKISGTASPSADLIRDSEKTVLGVYLEVAPETQKEVVFSYSLPPEFSEKFQEYDFLIQKQAGSQADPLSVDISYPDSWRIKGEGLVPSEAPHQTVQDEVEGLTRQYNMQYNNKSPGPKAQYKSTLEVDREIKVEFEK